MDAPDDNIYNPQSQLSRRAFIVGSLAAGFAVAVLPVSAETITTDANGPTVGEVKIPMEGGSVSHIPRDAQFGRFVRGYSRNARSLRRVRTYQGYPEVANAMRARSL